MKNISFIIINVLLYCNSNLAQEKTINGIVKFNGETISDVEVINTQKKRITKSDKDGVFTISASINDELVFYSKKYLTKKLILNKEVYSLEKIIIEIDKSQIELEEIEIKRSPNLKIDMSYESLNAIKIGKEASKPKIQGVYTGEIPNGMDFTEIGRKIYRLFFKKRDIGKVEDKGVKFKKYLSKNFTDDFFIKKLNLRTEEIPFFVDFCILKIDSSEVIYQNGVLDVMEFLILMRKEYKN